MHKIGVITAGGDAPGMNAAIRSVVRTGVFHHLEVTGIMRGYTGLIVGELRPLGARSVSGIINIGGTILRSARCEEIKTDQGIQKAIKTLETNAIEGLIVIGGDGTFRGASTIHKACGLPIVGIPATIDNDVNGTETTVGFDTAVNTATDLIDKIRDTATSHERVFIIEVMGRQRGFLALEVGVASGAEFILVPEIKYDVQKICNEITHERNVGKKSEIIVMAEGAGNSAEVVKEIQKQTNCEVRLTVLGYAQRGGSPTARSRNLGSLMGYYAVEELLQGSGQKMMSVQGQKIVPIDLAMAGKEPKPLDLNLHRIAEILSM